MPSVNISSMYLASDRIIAEHNQAELSKLERSLCTTLNAITLGVVTIRSIVRHTCRSKRMNAIIPLTGKPCSRGNYAWTEQAVKCWR